MIYDVILVVGLILATIYVIYADKKGIKHKFF